MDLIKRPIALLFGFKHPALVVENFLEQIAGAFLSLNIEPKLVFIDRDLNEQLADLDIDRVALVLSLGGLPLRININERPIYEIFQCPFILYLIDNILYEFNNIPSVKHFFETATHRGNLHLACCDQAYANMLSDTWHSMGSDKKALFVPMGGFFEGNMQASEKQDAIAVIGNLGALPAAGAKQADTLLETASINRLPETTDEQVNEIIYRVTGDEFKGNVAHEVMLALNLSAQELIRPDVLRLSTAIDRMLRLLSRYNKVASLRGLPVNLYGSGWKEAFNGYEGFTFCGQVTHPEVPYVLGRHKAMLNFDPGLEFGVHDRVISALSQGTRVLTNENKYLEKITIEETTEIITYRYSDTNIRSMAEQALNTPSQVQSADNRKNIFVNHGWHERIFKLMEQVNLS